jgi:DNA-binding transcriptional LysR family regulator
MDQPNITTIDLNLLRVFDSIFQEGNILRAAERMGMSQPAVSHALARLRRALKDDLFVRSSRGMLPTPRAEQLADPIRTALSYFELGLQSGPFDAATSERRFTIALDNASAISLTAAIIDAIAATAPHVRVDLRPSGTIDIDRMIDDGAVDLFIGKGRGARERFASEELFSDAFVVVHRAGKNPAAGPLSVADLISRAHVDLSSSGDDTGFVDDWLKQNGACRQVLYAVPLLGCESVLRQHDVFVVMRRCIALEICGRSDLEISDLPFASPASVTTCMRWHRKYDAQPTHFWLRQTIRKAIAGRFPNEIIRP